MAKARRSRAATKPDAARKAPSGHTLRLYEIEVALTQGPITRTFVKRNPHVLRTIQIRGDQTLQDLHDAIFKAFDRFDHHMYEFQIGGKGPMDPKARRYVLPMAMEDDFSDRQPSAAVDATRIDALGLKKNSVFGYWFDFGDDWWHQGTVLAIHEEVPRGTYPKVTARTGDSPPQYPLDEDEDDTES
jgi:hypothetical protein